MSASFSAISANYLSVPISGADLPSLGTTGYWIGAWVRPDRQLAFSTNYAIADVGRTSSFGTSGSAHALGADIRYRLPRAKSGNGTTASASTGNQPVVLDPVWSHVLVEFRSTADRRVYINGVQVGTTDTTAITPDFSTGSPQIRIGLRADGTSPFAGLVADVTVGTGTPSSGNRATLATVGGSYGSVPGIAHWWQLNGSLGDSVGSLTLSATGTVSLAGASPAAYTPITQAQYIQQVFSSSVLPTGTPTVTTGVTNPLSNVSNVGSVDQYDWSWATAINTAGLWRGSTWTTRGWLFRPTAPVGSHVVFFNPGHGTLADMNDTTAGHYGLPQHITSLLGAGYYVYLALMPGYCAQDSDYGFGSPDTHNSYWAYLNVGTYNPLELFLGHECRAWDVLKATYSKFSAIGLSGGAWRAVRLAALGVVNDTCVSIRGTVAHRRLTNDQFDFEQYAYPNGCINEDLYALAANNCKAVYFVNHPDDTCCFGRAPASLSSASPGGSYGEPVLYDDVFVRPLRKLYNKRIRFVQDTGVSSHSITSVVTSGTVLPALAASPLNAPGIMSDCAGWWPLNEGSGATATNSYGGYPSGSYVGTPTWGTSSPFSGSVVSLNGSSQRIQLGTSAVISGWPVTMAAWFQVSAFGTVQNLFSLSQDTGATDNFARLVVLTDGKLLWQTVYNGTYADAASMTTSSALTTNKWYLAVAVQESNVDRYLHLYDTSGLVESKSDLAHSGLPAVFNRTDIGNIYYNQPSGGYISQWFGGKAAWAGLWSRSLAPTEVSELWSSTLSSRLLPPTPGALAAPGDSSASFVGSVVRAGTISAPGDSSATFAGSSRVAAALAAAGDSSASFAWVATARSAFSAPGDSSAAFGAAGGVSSALTAPGDSSASFAGSSRITASLTAPGDSSAAFTAFGSASSVLTAPGDSSAAFTAARIVAAAISAPGDSSAAFTGRSTASAALSAPGDSSAAFASPGSTTLTGAFAATGDSSTAFTGARVVAAALSAPGDSSASFAGRSVVASAATVTGDSSAAFSSSSATTRSGILSAPGDSSAAFVGSSFAAGTFLTGGLSYVAFVSPPMQNQVRDRWFLRRIADLLVATNEFYAVTTTGLPEDVGRSAETYRHASLELTGFEETPYGTSGTQVPRHRTASFTLTIGVRDQDSDIRDDELDRLGNVAKNAINGQSLGGENYVALTYLGRRGRYQKMAGIERRLEIDGTFSYDVPDWNLHDTSEF